MAEQYPSIQLAFIDFLQKWGISADFKVEMQIVNMGDFFNLFVPEAYLDMLDETAHLLDSDVNWSFLNKQWKDIVNAYKAG